MTHRQAFTALRDVLAKLYNSKASARRVCYDAGLDMGHIVFRARAVDNWTAILDEAERQGVVAVLIAMARKEHPTNQLLHDAVEAYITWVTDPQMPGAHASGLAHVAQDLDAARAIKNEWARVQVLAALAPKLQGKEKTRALGQGLDAARAIKHEETRARALEALVPQLSGKLLAQGLDAAQAIKNDEARDRVLVSLVPRLSGELLVQGLDAVRAIKNEMHRAEALAALAPRLSGELLVQGLAAALAIKNDEARDRVLVALVPRLSEELLVQGLTAALAIKNDEARDRVLVALVPRLSGALLVQGLTAALAIQHEGYRAQALAALAPQLSGELLVQGLTAALAIKYEWYRTRALIALAPRLSGELLVQGLAAALAIQHEGYRAQALAALAPQLSGELLVQGPDTARAIIYEQIDVPQLATQGDLARLLSVSKHAGHRQAKYEVAELQLELSYTQLDTPTVEAFAVAKLKDHVEGQPLLVQHLYELLAGVSNEALEGFVSTPIRLHNESLVDIDIFVYAEKIEIRPHWKQTVRFSRKDGSNMVSFELIPKVHGFDLITVEFYYERHWLTKIEIEVEIIDQKAVNPIE